MAAVTSIMRVQQIFLSRTEEILRPLDLTFSRYEVLMLLTFSSKGELPLSKIGERLQVHGSSVTNSIDRLEAQGFVRRVPNPRDGRGTLAVITPTGRQVAQRATEAANRGAFTDLGIDDGDVERLFEILRAVRHAAGDFA